MLDLLFIAVVVAFFALAALLVRACDRLVGPDAHVVGTLTPAEAPDEAVAV